jgi:uncharacterized protein YjgD (DUF1641 family)
MAEPILLNFPPEDPREILRKRLENAPMEHAEALLSLMDVVQELHDKGLLEIAKGALGSGDKVMKIAVDAANTPEVIQGIRNMMILAKLFAGIDPKLLEALAGAMPDALDKARTEHPMSTPALLFTLTGAHARRVLGIAARVADAMGRGLATEDKSP